MPFTVPAPRTQLTLNSTKTYKYIINWRACHEAGGERLPDGVKYSEEIVLSLVLSYLAPFTTNSMDDQRTAIAADPADTKTPERVNQEILAITLASLMTLAKPVTAQNSAAFSKRWKAALASQSLTDLIPSTSWAGIIGVASVFHTIVSGKPDLRLEIVDRLLALKKLGAEGAILSQVKLVWEFSSLKAVQYMDLFIKSHCRAMEIPAVLDQAVDLHEKWESAKREDPLLPYSRVRDPGCHPNLNQAHYPDLYYAAITYAKLNKLVGDNFQMSTSHTSTHAMLIEKYIKRMAVAELGELSEEARAKLSLLGYPVTSNTKRRTRVEYSDEEEDDTPPAPRRRRRD